MIEERSYYLWEKQSEFGHIGVRRVDLVLKDGVEIAKTYHRHVLSPGDNTDGEDDEVKAIAEAVWTPEVVKTYKEKKEKDAKE